MIYAKNLNTNTKTGGGGTLVWDGRSWNNAPSTPTIERTKTSTPSPSSSQSSGGSSSRSSSSGSSSQPTAKNLNTDTSTGGGGNLVWDGTRWNEAPAGAPAKPANMTSTPTIQRTTSRASGTGAPSNPTPLPLAARAPSASYGLTGATQPTITRGIGTPRYSLSVSGGGITDQDRKKALEDELAALWGYMEKYKGTLAYDGYARRAAEIEAEQKAASTPAAAAPSAPSGAFGSGVNAAGQRTNYNTAPGQQMQTPATVGERRPNPYGGEDVVWTGSNWEPASAYAAQQARAAAPTIERQKPAAQQAPATTRTDYVPPTESRFESTPGFDQADYKTAYVNAQVGDVNNAYAETIRRNREDYAARGLSQAGRSGAEQQALVMAEIARNNAAGQVGADATKTAMEMGRTDAIERARNIDSYGISRGNFGINMARDNRDATREDSMLPLDTQIKVLEAAGINLRNAGIQLANDGSVIQNDHNRAIVDFYKQTRNIDMTRMQQGVDAGALDLQKSANELEIMRGTTAERIAQIKAAATSANLANERTRFDIDYAQSVAPTLRATAEAQLREIEQRVTAAAQKQDWAMVDELGKIAGRVAKAGGFKVAGGILGTVIGSIIPGAGNVAGGAVGTAIGAGLDGILGG